MSPRVIVASIIVAVPDQPTNPPQTARSPTAGQGVPPTSEQLVRFYDDSYAHEGQAAQLYARWRALGAQGKADHVTTLCARAGIDPHSTLDVGCGDGALLSELRRRGFGGELHGVEITDAAVRIASERAEIDTVERYDGERLAISDGAYELGIVSHVLEHVPDPSRLLAEVARVCAAVVIEVPLEDNLSARRAGKREHAQEVGHLQRLNRTSARAMVAQAGLRVAGELEDPLPLEVQRFFASTIRAEAAALGKWSLRSATHRIAPALAKRLFTVHYACLCLSRA